MSVEEATPKVTLLQSPDPEIIAKAARLCYSSDTIDDLIEEMSEDKSKALITKLKDMGHESPFEHIQYTFGIEGMSRIISQQMTRHRIASYSQKSQRYVKEASPEYIIPEPMKKNPEAVRLYRDAIQHASTAYNQLLRMDINPEDARSVLPNGIETKIIATYNVRSLYNFFEKRLCTRAQKEIQTIAKQMYDQVVQEAPYLFEGVGAYCKSHGYCPEGKMSCGMKPTIDKLLESYNKE